MKHRRRNAAMMIKQIVTVADLRKKRCMKKYMVISGTNASRKAPLEAMLIATIVDMTWKVLFMVCMTA